MFELLEHPIVLFLWRDDANITDRHAVKSARGVSEIL